MDNGASSYHRFLDGDDNGIVEIIREYKDGLLLYLNTFTFDIHTAEDLVEDTFFRLVVKKPKFAGKSSFKTWLYSIGRNVAMDSLRKKRRKALPIEAYGNIPSDEDIEFACITQDNNRVLHKALRKLNSEYQQILQLRYFEDFNNTEASLIMKKSKKQIENLVYRAKGALKEELEKEGFEYEIV